MSFLASLCAVLVCVYSSHDTDVSFSLFAVVCVYLIGIDLRIALRFWCRLLWCTRSTLHQFEIRILLRSIGASLRSCKRSLCLILLFVSFSLGMAFLVPPHLDTQRSCPICYSPYLYLPCSYSLPLIQGCLRTWFHLHCLMVLLPGSVPTVVVVLTVVIE